MNRAGAIAFNLYLVALSVVSWYVGSQLVARQWLALRGKPGFFVGLATGVLAFCTIHFGVGGLRWARRAHEFERAHPPLKAGSRTVAITFYFVGSYLFLLTWKALTLVDVGTGAFRIAWSIITFPTSIVVEAARVAMSSPGDGSALVPTRGLVLAPVSNVILWWIVWGRKKRPAGPGSKEFERPE